MMEGAKLSKIVCLFLLVIPAYCTRITDVIEFGKLEVAFDTGKGYFSDRVTNTILPDPSHPGSFLFDYFGSALLRYDSSHHNVTLVCGSLTERGANKTGDGPALNARFYLINDFTFQNDKILLVDFLAQCIKMYDPQKDIVIVLMGVCNSEEGNAARLTIQSGTPGDATDSFLVGPIQVVYASIGNFYLVVDTERSWQGVYIIDAETLVVQPLFSSRDMPGLQKFHSLLLSPDESQLYFYHNYALARFDMQTRKYEKLVGEKNGNENSNPPTLQPGPFHAAKINSLGSILWLVPDQILVSSVKETQDALIVFDLVKEEVSLHCVGDGNMTVVGSLDECEVNAITSLALAKDNMLFINSFTEGESKDYWEQGITTTIYKMQLNAKQCESQGLDDDTVDVTPQQTLYDYGSTVELSCPEGFGLNSTYDTLKCTSASPVQLDWDNPLPECSNQLRVDTVYPLSGQVAGGTLITATGLLPSNNSEISVTVKLEGREMNLDFNRMANHQAVFRIPGSGSLGIAAEIKLNLYETTSTYRYTYLPNPIISTVSLFNIPSGGVDGIFTFQNQNSALHYRFELINYEMETSMQCTKVDSQVKCALPNITTPLALPSRYVDLLLCTNVTRWFVEIFSGDEQIPSRLPAAIYGDGVLISKDLNITTHSNDPEITRPKTTQIAKSIDDTFYEVLVEGKNLDLDALNTQYNISIIYKNQSVDCRVVTVNITDTRIPCLVNGTILAKGTLHLIEVNIGNLIGLNAGEVQLPGLLAATRPTVEGTNLQVPEIAAVAVVVGLVVLIVLMIGGVFIYRKYQEKRTTRDGKVQINSVGISSENGDVFININLDLKQKVTDFSISPQELQVKLDDPIGRGNFGVIYLGQLRKEEKFTTVAVKILKEMETTQAIVEKFLEEAVFLQDFHHANVLPTFGVCWPPGTTPQVVLPYMANGDLRSLIRKASLELMVGDLLHFAMQVACGMEYLSDNKFVHRDLAARNCLVSDKYIVKIADFGLSRDIYARDYYRPNDCGGVPLPVKWLSVEILKGEAFTSKSDVWSFGVLMWELLTRGNDPYPDVDTWDMKNYLEAGHRLPQPDLTPVLIYKMMLTCWDEKPEKRPSFTKLHDFLSRILSETAVDEHGSYTYTYIREYTSDISDGYVSQPYEA